MGTAMNQEAASVEADSSDGDQKTRTIIVQDGQGSSPRMTIPEPARDQLDIGPGDVLLVRPTGDEEFIVKTSKSVWGDDGVE